MKLSPTLLAAGAIALASFLSPSSFAVVAKAPVAQIWQPPRLVIASQVDAPIQVQSVRLTGDVRGRHAWTEIDMTFFNPNRRVLEGELQFPLLDGQHITAFSMDVNGVLRAAVPVEKAKGQAVFEDVIRGRIDPGLLEVTQGNNFKLRVYPIPAAGTKRVVLRIEETLGQRGGRSEYRLPLAFGDRIGNLAVDVRVAGIEGRPQASSRAVSGLTFDREGNDGYRLHFNRTDFTADARATLDIAGVVGNGPVTYTQVYEGRTYFIADLPLRSAESPRDIPNTVGLVWDSSGSGATRDHGREFALLDAYFSRMRNGEVRLTRIRHDAEAVRVFRIVNGQWGELRKALADTAYDGATNLGAFTPEASVREYLLFSDGLSNFGDKPFAKMRVPLMTVSAASKSDATFLRHVAHQSGGRFIDLTRIAPADGINALLNTSAHIASVTSNQASQLVMSSPWPDGGRVLIGGVLDEREATLRLTLANAGGKTQQLDVAVKAGSNNGLASTNAAAQWAQLRVAELEGEYAFNRGEIHRLGQRFKLVTRETSLIILDRVEDYARFEIAPPPELRVDYERILGSLAQQRSSEKKSHLEDIVRLFENKVRWWNRDFAKDEPRKKEAKIAVPAIALSATADSTVRRAENAPRPAQEIRESTVSAQKSVAMPAVPVFAPPAAPAVSGNLTAGAGVDHKFARNTADAMSTTVIPPVATEATIRLQKWQPDSPFAMRLREAAAADLYRVYLDEKPGYLQSTAFFLDAADVFFERGQAELGIRVLSNLAEMDLENRHILRVLGYRLMQAKQPALALPVFRKVLALSPEEPQSYRDLGLAYAADKQAQKAIDSLYEVVIRPWHNRFPEIELITLAELNSIVATNASLDTSRIDPRLLKNLPLDLRAVLTWDADNTDIDLWVTDPNGESAYYGNQLTYQGGRMSMDFTGGYGPEEFSLRTAKPGKYKVEANYFGDRRQNITGATTLSLKLSTHFGSGNQEDKIVTMRLKDRKEKIFVGEFEVK